MTQNIPVVENILNANDRIAQQNFNRLEEAGVFSINILASPGAGKTSLIEQTLPRLKGKLRVAAIDGDIATSIDSDRAAAAGALAAIQINTGGDCHLDAVMLHGALEKLDLTQFDLLIVENVGNLVCPANFKLGTHKTVLVASVPEGDDKPYKYPGTYRGVDVLVINKIDLLPYVNFRMDYFERGVQALNPGVTTFHTSCTTGEGLDAWADWLIEQAKR
ncbi:MAG TPA: hydrogenase nickel incorporation protein HypB [Anaerolineales bacterium]|nr:hydrogenase nickel incorporation protein HypB [Anaerolineales bacterium]